MKFAKVMFLHVSVCPQGGGIPACIAGGIPACLAGIQGVSRPKPREKLRGLARGISRPTPRGVSRPTPRGVSRPTLEGVSRPTLEGVSRPTPRGVCVSQHALRQTPRGRLLPRAVRILLECILVSVTLTDVGAADRAGSRP